MDKTENKLWIIMETYGLCYTKPFPFTSEEKAKDFMRKAIKLNSGEEDLERKLKDAWDTMTYSEGSPYGCGRSEVLYSLFIRTPDRVDYDDEE